MPYIGAVACLKRRARPWSDIISVCFASPASWAPCSARAAPAATAESYDPWPGLVQDIFNNRPMNDGSDVIAIEMPYRAEDAAIVPVTLRTKLPPGDSRRVLSDYAGHRPKSGTDGGKVRTGAGRQRVGNLDPRSGQQLYRRSCGRRAERRQALHGEDLCQGLRRLFRAGRQERRRSQEPDWARCDTGNSQSPAKVRPAAPARRRS